MLNPLLTPTAQQTKTGSSEQIRTIGTTAGKRPVVPHSGTTAGKRPVVPQCGTTVVLRPVVPIVLEQVKSARVSKRKTIKLLIYAAKLDQN